MSAGDLKAVFTFRDHQSVCMSKIDISSAAAAPDGGPANAVLDLILREVTGMLQGKGAAVPPMNRDTVFLGGDIDIDSLDLATLVVLLEEHTGFDPFRAGFRNFSTVGELADLYLAR
jgi:acyl carrier protein